MNEYEAQNSGYRYCGPSISAYPRQREIEIWEKDKAIAKQIKKEYAGADYKIVSGTARGWLSSGFKAIYGNDVFNKLWQVVAYGHTPEQIIERCSKRKDAISEKYHNEMGELETEIERAHDLRSWLDSIKK